jgi:PTS system cellobiose-specific IIC component
LFNISEPMVFGIPLVMNPYFFLPFILTPVLLVIVSYTAMATGLVAPPGIALPFTTPIFISGYLATGGHISGTVLQVVNLSDFAGGLLSVLPGLGSAERRKKSTPRRSPSERYAVCGRPRITFSRTLSGLPAREVANP